MHFSLGNVVFLLWASRFPSEMLGERPFKTTKNTFLIVKFRGLVHEFFLLIGKTLFCIEKYDRKLLISMMKIYVFYKT